MTGPTANRPSLDDLVEAFLEAEAKGLKKDAKTAVRAIVAAVPTAEAKADWVQRYLARVTTNGASRIRHEIFEEILFPVLKADFEHGVPDASYHLGMYWQNLVSSRALWAAMGTRSATDFFRIAFEAKPTSPLYRRAYLASQMQDLDYTFHEWPAGILLDPTDWRLSLRALNDRLSALHALDVDGQFTAKLADWQDQCAQYEQRLTQHENRT